MRSFNRLLVTLLPIVLPGAFSLPVFGAVQAFALDPAHTQVHVTWNHAGFSNPGATFNISDGTLVWNDEEPSQSSVTVTIPVKSVDTQVPELDDKFKTEYFEVSKYPTVTFKSTGVEQIGQSDHYRVKGQLTVHGITQPVTLDATLNKTGEHPILHAPAIGFDATATVKHSEFGLGAYIPIVSDRVQIHITAEAVDPDALAKAMQAAKAETQSQ